MRALKTLGKLGQSAAPRWGLEARRRHGASVRFQAEEAVILGELLEDADECDERKRRELDEALLAKVAVKENRLEARRHSAACGRLSPPPEALALGLDEADRGRVACRSAVEALLRWEIRRSQNDRVGCAPESHHRQQKLHQSGHARADRAELSSFFTFSK